MIQVPFFDYPALFRTHEARFLEAIGDVLHRGAFILQEEVDKFELMLAEFVGVESAVGVGNCTDALDIGLAATGIGPGDEVIVPSHTFVASVSAIVRAGATPILVDVADDHLIDPQGAAAAVSPRTAAIMPVSLNGRACDFPELQRLADRHGLLIIEDSAQALGASIDGIQAGSAGLWGTYSFYPAKNLGCFGDGGALVTDSREVARFARSYRDHGRDSSTGEIKMWGVNSRLDNLQAAILIIQLEHYDRKIARRREIASVYDQGLSDLEQLGLPPSPGNGRHFDTFQNYEIEALGRDELRESLSVRGVGTAVQWNGRAVHQFKALSLDFDLPRTEALFKSMLLLPMNHLLSDSQAHYVVESVRSFYGH